VGSAAAFNPQPAALHLDKSSVGVGVGVKVGVTVGVNDGKAVGVTVGGAGDGVAVAVGVGLAADKVAVAGSVATLTGVGKAEAGGGEVVNTLSPIKINTAAMTAPMITAISVDGGERRTEFFIYLI
jgi:hypothetical protein